MALTKPDRTHGASGLFARFAALSVAASLPLVLGLVVVQAQSASAATVNVTNCNDSGAGSLRQAIANANSGDTIALSPSCSVITLTSGDISIPTNLTITGPGAGALAVSGNNASQVFAVDNGITVAISGLTVENGSATPYGGGIYNQGTLHLNDVSIMNNTATNDGANGGAGAGIFNSGGNATLDNTTVSSNTAVSSSTAGGSGGGIYTLNGTLTLNDSTVSSNTVTGTVGGGGGGGIFNYFSTVVLNDSTVSSNTAFAGGGIFSWGGSLTSQDTTTISNNSATTQGGGIFLNAGNLTLTSTSDTFNGAVDGGGIYNSSGALTANGSSVSSNTASDLGGGIYEAGGTTSLTATTVAYNTPDNIYPPPQSPTVTGVSPNSGLPAGGTSVTVTGTGFFTTPGATTFDFSSDNPGTGVSCSSSTTCTVTSPPGTGTVDVAATVAGQTSSENPPGDQFTYEASRDAPSSVIAVAGESSAAIAWGSPTPPAGDGITGFSIQTSPPAAGSIVSLCESNAPCASIGGLTDGMSYSFTVSVDYSDGSSVPSSSSNAIIPGPPAGVCGLEGPAVALPVPVASIASAVEDRIDDLTSSSISVSTTGSAVVLGSASAAVSVPCSTGTSGVISDLLSDGASLDTTVTVAEETQLQFKIEGGAELDTGDIDIPVGAGVSLSLGNEDLDLASLGAVPYVGLSLTGGFNATIDMTSAASMTLPIQTSVVYSSLTPILPPVPSLQFSVSGGTISCPGGACLAVSVPQSQWGTAAELQFGVHILGDVLDQGIGAHVGTTVDAIGGADTSSGGSSAWGMVCAGVDWDAEADIGFPDLLSADPQTGGTLAGPFELASFGSPPSGCPAQESVTAVPESSTPGFPNPTTTYEVNAVVTDANGIPVQSLPVTYISECVASAVTWLEFTDDCGQDLGTPANALTNSRGVATDSIDWQPGPLDGFFGTPLVTADAPGISDNNTVELSLASTAATSGTTATAGGSGTVTPQVSATASGGQGTVAVAQLYGPPPGSAQAFEGGTGDYVDVSVSSNQFSSVTMTVCDYTFTSASTLDWLNPAVNMPTGQWQPVVPSSAVTFGPGSPGFLGIGATPSCLSFTITNSTTPSLGQLGGTVFATSEDAIVPVSTTLELSPSPAIANENASLIATVTPGTGTIMPTGSVEFFDGASALGTAQLNDQTPDQATFTTALAAGTHDLWASFEAPSPFSAGTPALLVEEVDIGPAFASDSPTSATFTQGNLGSVTVTALGTPTPSLVAGPLPGGISFTDNGNGTGTITGTPTEAGTFPFMITASNGIGSPAQQGFTLLVDDAPTITSTCPLTALESANYTCTIATTGNPTPSLSESGPMPPGITFVDNGDGTATLSGIPGPGTGGSYPITIAASNGIGNSAQQDFTLVNSAVAITSADSATAVASSPFRFMVTTTTNDTTSVPVIKGFHLPTGLRVVDNRNGTAMISGIPAAKDTGLYTATITATIKSQPIITQSFGVTVDNLPVFKSKTKYTATTGVAFAYPITTLYGYPPPTITTSSTLPGGVTLTDNHNGTATLGGTPAPNAGGMYVITLTATSGNGVAVNQIFTLTVYQPPVITSNWLDTTNPGQAMMPFTVTDAGYPVPTLKASSLPSGVKLIDNKNLTGTIAGTPKVTATGTYTVPITASNKAGSTTQTFTLTVGTTSVGSAAASLTSDGTGYCAVLTAGSIDCWGDNSEGQLGDGTTGGSRCGGDCSATPAAVNGISSAASLASDGYGYCALLTSGSVDCWGGAPVNSDVPVAVSGIASATRLVSDYKFGGYCALLTSGSVDCWGDNSVGELGDGSTQSSDVPVAVSGITTATSLAGNNGYCALLTSGSVDCWGWNGDGELGDGTTGGPNCSGNCSATPVTVSGITAATSLVSENEMVGFGGYCALLTSGSVDCWGYNSNGELGNGTYGGPNCSGNCSDTPATIGGITTATSLLSDEKGYCALLTSGSVDCWGDNSAGELGDGTTVSSDVPAPVSFTAATTSLASNDGYCALLTSGSVDCWGNNKNGELGDGTTGGPNCTGTCSATPVPVSGIATVVSLVSDDIGNGGGYCALLGSGSVDCWGYNPNGELGDGSTAAYSDEPVPVSGIGP